MKTIQKPTLDDVAALWRPADNRARMAALAALAGKVDADTDDRPLICKPKETARRLSCCTRTVANLAKQKLLQPIRLPGRHRILGYTRASVEALARGACNEAS